MRHSIPPGFPAAPPMSLRRRSSVMCVTPAQKDDRGLRWSYGASFIFQNHRKIQFRLCNERGPLRRPRRTRLPGNHHRSPPRDRGETKSGAEVALKGPSAPLSFFCCRFVRLSDPCAGNGTHSENTVTSIATGVEPAPGRSPPKTCLWARVPGSPRAPGS